MKNIYLVVFLFLATLIPSLVLGATKDITISWTMTNVNIQEVQEFRIFINYTDVTLNRVQLQDCTAATETNGIYSMACNGVNIEQYPAYFSIEADIPDVDNVESGIWTVEAPTISVVQGFTALTPTSELPTTTFSLAVNFQQGSDVVPDGFLKDWGASFDDARTPGYGWVGTLPTETRNRNNPLSPDESYDTFLLAYSGVTWEAAVTNGTYKVTVCVGDVTYPSSSTHSLQVEGESVINQENTTTENRWIVREANVNISDGRITVTFSGANQYTAFCWIKVKSI